MIARAICYNCLISWVVYLGPVSDHSHSLAIMTDARKNEPLGTTKCLRKRGIPSTSFDTQRLSTSCRSFAALAVFNESRATMLWTF